MTKYIERRRKSFIRPIEGNSPVVDALPEGHFKELLTYDEIKEFREKNHDVFEKHSQTYAKFTLEGRITLHSKEEYKLIPAAMPSKSIEEVKSLMAKKRDRLLGINPKKF